MIPDLTKLEGKTILIAGWTGFIGTALWNSLNEIKTNAVFLPSHADLEDRLIFENSADIVIHAAGYGQPNLFIPRPIETIDVNTDLTAWLFKALKPGGTFLFCSSSEIYSGLDKVANENHVGVMSPWEPRAAYVYGKLAGETIVNAYRKQGVRAFSARISSAYGPGTRKHDTKAMNQFIEAALTKKRIELQDSGRAIRTYCYIDDTVEMLWNIILNGTQAVYNVGGHSVASVADIAKKVGELTGAEVVIPTGAADRTGGPQTVRLDLSRVETEFGKTDYINLDEGLARTIEYQRGLYND
jgi:nucleoside-diphosphate-sugar epimerase